MGRTAVVFGSTGLVGKELVKVLLSSESYDKVVAVARRRQDIADPKLEQVEISDFTNLIKVQDKLDAAVYFCCIGTTMKTAGSKEAFRKVDFEIPKQIAILADQLSINYMVVISSLGAKAVSSNFYLKTKGEMEETVRHIYHGNLKIVRPSLLMGKRSEFRFGERFAVFFMKVFGWLFIGPLKKYKGISAENVALAMIRTAEYPSDKIVYESDELYRLLKY